MSVSSFIADYVNAFYIGRGRVRNIHISPHIQDLIQAEGDPYCLLKSSYLAVITNLSLRPESFGVYLYKDPNFWLAELPSGLMSPPPLPNQAQKHCECGSATIRSGNHSAWCPLYSKEF